MRLNKIEPAVCIWGSHIGTRTTPLEREYITSEMCTLELRLEILAQVPFFEDLADMTGTTVETTSRVMSEFRKQGLIESGRQWVAIVNEEALARVADGRAG